MHLLFLFRRYWLLSAALLLAGCRSERMAFSFQPGPVSCYTVLTGKLPGMASDSASWRLIRDPTSGDVVTGGPPRKTTVATASVLPPHQTGGSSAARSASAPKPLARLARQYGRRAATARPATAPAGRGPSDKSMALMLLGLLFVVGGLVTLVVAAIILSGTTALVGLGLVVLGPLLFILGLNAY